MRRGPKLIEIIAAIDDARGGFGWHGGSYPRIVRNVNVMSNPQLDQFTSALWWKVVPWLVLGGGVGLLAGVFVKWLERRARAMSKTKIAKGQGDRGDVKR